MVKSIGLGPRGSGGSGVVRGTMASAITQSARDTGGRQVEGHGLVMLAAVVLVVGCSVLELEPALNVRKVPLLRQANLWAWKRRERE